MPLVVRSSELERNLGAMLEKNGYSLNRECMHSERGVDTIAILIIG